MTNVYVVIAADNEVMAVFSVLNDAYLYIEKMEEKYDELVGLYIDEILLNPDYC
jgi:hypothetical protein